jgi:hypothetical protein
MSAHWLVQLEARKAAIVEADTAVQATQKVYTQLDPDVDWDVVGVRLATEEEI